MSAACERCGATEREVCLSTIRGAWLCFPCAEPYFPKLKYDDEFIGSQRDIATEIRRAIEPLRGESKWAALRHRALLIELAESPGEVRALCADVERLGFKVTVTA
jgi:hypothetical protein